MAEPLPPDPYKTLGVDRSATADTIKKAYRKAALRCHPDKTKDPAAVDEFHNIQQAYDILSDEEKKQHYEATVRLHSLRRDLQGARSSTSPAARDFSHSSPRAPAFDDKQRSRTDWSTGWSSRGFFTSEERVPPKSAEVPPQARSTPLRQSTFDEDYDLPELNRSTSRKDGASYTSTRRPATSKSAKSSDSKSSKSDKSSLKDKVRNEAKRMRERAVQQDRGRKLSAADPESSDDSRRMASGTSRSRQDQPPPPPPPPPQPQPRRRSDTTGARSAATRESRKSDDENVYRQDKFKEHEDLRKPRVSAETAPPPSYRAPNVPEGPEGRRSSRDARPSLSRRSSSRTAPTAAPKESASSSRPPSRRASPVRRSSRTREAMDQPSTEKRRPPPSMPSSKSSPAGGSGIKLPEDMRGRSHDDYAPRRRPSVRYTEAIPSSNSPHSSAERFEREQRDRIYDSTERAERERERERERSSGRVRSARNETLERSASDGYRTAAASSRRNYHEDAAPAVSSNLRHGENNDSGCSTSSPSETPVDQFMAPPEPKKKLHSYPSGPKPDEPYVAQVRAPAGSRRTTSSVSRDDKTSYPPSVAAHDRSRAPPSRSGSFSSSIATPPGLSRRSSHRADSSSRPRPSIVTRNETMPLPARSRDSPLQASPVQTGFKVSSGYDGYLFGEKIRATSPEEMDRSARELPPRRDSSVRLPFKHVAYARNFSSDDVAFGPSTGSLGRQGSSGRTAPYVEPQYQYVRPRRQESVH